MLAVPPLPLLRPDSADVRLDRACARGEVVRIARGVYVEASTWRALPPWDQDLARIHAVALTRPAAAFALTSAATLYGVSIGRTRHPVHLVDALGSSREIDGVRVHRTANDLDLRMQDGLLLTSPGVTAVDLARTQRPAEALAYVNALMRIDPTLTRERLAAENERRPSSRGRRRARWVIERATPTPESVLESGSLAAIEWLGYEAPVCQQAFAFEGARDRTDFFWPEDRIAGEADGDVKYDGRFGAPEDALRDQRQREARLRRNLDGVARWGWAEVRRFERLDQELQRAGLHRMRPRDVAQLVTLRSFGA